jgi:diguanylate cyclase (GGDEF)-like protein
MELSAPRRRTALFLCVALVAGFAVVLRVKPGGELFTQSFDDIGEAVAAALGAIPCFWRAVRTSGRWRLSWALLGAGLAAWSIGEWIWSYYEVIEGSEVPFPSLADAGYLLFPVFCLAGLFVRPSAAFVGRARLRVLLDGTMVVASLFILSWATALGAVYHAGAQNTFSLVVSLAYPASDLVLITVAVLVASRARLDAGLVLLVGGLTSMAVADSAFAYLVAAGTYGTGAFTDVAWVAAFLAIGVSALFPTAEHANSGERVDGSPVIVLPYLLLLAGIVAMFIAIVHNGGTPVTFGVETTAILALLLRQLIVVLDNRRLTLDVMAQKAELTYRAFHDPLTGLANRALFYDRLAHALDLHRRDLRPVSVVFVDLDDFKSVNDAFGHDAGDIVLTEVARRLLDVVRTGDTVARLGGDEFAVLVEDDGDPTGVAERILESLSAPVRIGDRLAPARASIGTTTLDPGRDSCDIQELLRRADVAMYSAKRAGKGTSVSYVPGLGGVAETDLARHTALREDIAAGRIDVDLAPIATPTSGTLLALGATPRWSYLDADVALADVVALADRSGQLADLDLCIIEQAIAAARLLDDTAPVLVTTRIPLARMADLELPRRIGELIARLRLDPGHVVIGIDEPDTPDQADAVAVLDALRGAGAGLAIDHFGVGYSNLARLELVQPDLVRLGGSLVAPLVTAPQRTLLLRRVIELAHDLGAAVVADGVDTDAVRDALTDIGCDAVQGAVVAQNALHAAHAAEVA